MITLLRLARLGSLLMFMFLLVLFSGCASSKTAGEEKIAVDEEAYIDLKQGFALVIPATWKREKIPVSSPQYRSDVVSWTISSNKAEIGSLQIRAVGHPDKLSLQDYLCEFLNEQKELHHSEIFELEHSAGKALRLNGEDTQYKVIYLVIAGQKLTYLAAFQIAAEDHEEVLPLIEKVIKSFSILHQSES